MLIVYLTSYDDPENPINPLIILICFTISYLVLNNYYSSSVRKPKQELKIFKEIDWLGNPNEIKNMSGKNFELFLYKLFKSIGYNVTLTPSSNDQGADLILRKEEQIIAVQAKRYSKPVGNRAVQEIVAAIPYYGATEGWVITTSSYTNSAINLANANNIRLIGWNGLIKLIKQIPREDTIANIERKNDCSISNRTTFSDFIQKNSDLLAIIMFILGPFAGIKCYDYSSISTILPVLGIVIWILCWLILAIIIIKTMDKI